MKKFSKLTLMILLCALVLTTLLVPMQAQAASYIYNWGKRGEVATSLSTNAQKFYTGSYTFATLSKASGGTTKDNAPSSTLYNQLKTLMTSKHSHQTSYAETREEYRYTDCQNGGGKISSFYSGKEIGPGWDGTWNREHTWPNSKGLGGADENDIMMLRPTSTSENSSRGNTAYGKSSGYYNPNSESGGKYDLRGDVARICLYVYTRWGNTGRMWGSSGVMESLDVLLEWMQADPVDTWELGRNDAVQAITGTRNVYVDYPEYAFLLFGRSVPSNYSTPSQSNGVTPPTPEDCTHSFGAATCTEPQTCTKCWATQGAALGHTTPDANGKCTRCGEILEIKTTHAGTQADPYSIADAYKVAETLTSGASSEKVYVKGQVVSAGEVVSNKYRKSLTIKDSSTNEILSINTANPKNSSDLNLKAGDTILLEGYIRINNSTQKAEMGTGSGGNYTYYSIVPAGQGGGTTHTHSFSQATCTTPATCSCGQTQGAALGHTTTSGTCTRCGVTIGGGQGSVTPDATVESFKQAVTNIQSATTLEQKFAAIKIAVNIYNTMDATQKAQVTTEIETLKTNINNYNVDTTSQNTNSNNALIFIGVSLAEALALALLLLKKVF